MPNYQTDVYPHRNDTNAFVNALLRGLTEYTSNLEVGYSGRIPGSGATPSDMDKRRVRALLDAWNKNISDDYLDYPSVRELDRGFDRSQGRENAIRRARRLLNNRALRSISTDLPADQIVASIRNNPSANYNSMYSAILSWCDTHCYGLPNYIISFRAVMAGAGGGDSALPIIYQASLQYIVEHYNARSGVYARYFLPRTLMSYVSIF